MILSNLSIGDKIRFNDNVNQTIFVNTTSTYYFNGTDYTDLASSASVFTGANATINGTSGLVPQPLTSNYQQCLLGNGSWGDCDGVISWTRNATTNITSLTNVQDNVNLTRSNITTIGTGFFGWLGSLVNKVTKIWTVNLNVNNTIEFRDENHSLSANDTAIYYYNGSTYIDLTSEGDNYWSRNSTSNITSLANSQDNVELANNLKITGDLNMTSNNITTVDCITFISGGKICNSA